MNSLAQRIFDSAHNHLTSNDKQYKKDVRSVFSKNVQRGVTEEMSVEIAALLKPMMAGLPDISRDLSGAMKFVIDKSVAQAVEKMFKTPDETILKALKFAELPYYKTWIEYSTEANDLKVGWLIEKYEDGLSIKSVASTDSTNHTPMYNNGTSHFFVNSSGFNSHPDSERHNRLPQTFFDTNDKNKVNQGKHAIILLLLLNSRSNILKVTLHGRTDEKRVNNRLKARGKPEKAFLNKIKFDVSRIVGKHSISREEAAKEMAASLVRGHFKIRKTGVFFWSPYVRGAKSEEEKEHVREESLGRERQVTKSGRTVIPHFR